MQAAGINSALIAGSKLFQRDLMLAWRNRGEVFNPLLFFVLVISLFPLGVSPDPALLQKMSPGLLWVVALLSALLASDGMFREDYEDGCLDQILLAPQPLYLLVIAKVFAHWFISGVPLVLAAPGLAMLVYLPADAIMSLVLSLFLGTLCLSFIGAIGAALTVSLRQSGVLMSLIVLPLYIPVLIFGAGSVAAAAAGFDFHAQVAILGAFALLAIAIAPLAIAGALRLSADN